VKDKPILSFMASENGTAARSVIGAINNGRVDAEIGVVITNNANAPIVPWCEKNAVPIKIISRLTNPDDEDEELTRQLKECETTWVILSGYRKKIHGNMIKAFDHRILNIHPSMLPNHGGMFGDDIHQSVLDSGDKWTGITIHIVNEEYDKGPIVAQTKVPVSNADSVKSLGDRVRSREPEFYITVIQEVLGQS
jgi:phosphoribosylglycinamide formyltransferase-1